MGELRQKFESWFKTTTAYRMLESMNYYKMDLFHFVDGRGEYRHTSVQMVFMTWVEQQSKIEQLEKRKAEITRLVQSLRNEFDLWDGCPQVERQIELLEEALRGDK